ncbi:MAG: iron-sulfur cluster assembly scaffold protein [Epsilonproteobacteria bacterium]|nr:iron-sulfur cluster assembly scaffold protein [Campylobacterota bacterium]
MDSKYIEMMLDPPNYGEMKQFSAKGIGKNKETGEMVIIYLKVDPSLEIVEDIKWQTNGCGTTIVSGGLFSQEYKGKSLKEGLDFTNAVFEKIKDNPPADAACGEVVARAFIAAVKDYEARKKGEEREFIEYVTLSCPPGEVNDRDISQKT